MQQCSYEWVCRFIRALRRHFPKRKWDQHEQPQYSYVVTGSKSEQKTSQHEAGAPPATPVSSISFTRSTHKLKLYKQLYSLLPMNSRRWMEAITKALVNGSNVSKLFLKQRTSDPPSFRCLFCFKWIISKDVSGLLGNAIIRGYKGTVPSELRLKEHLKRQTVTDYSLPCLARLQPSLGNCLKEVNRKHGCRRRFKCLHPYVITQAV